MILDDETRVVTADGEIIATFGREWYAGHVAAVVEKLNLPGVRVETNFMEDDKTVFENAAQYSRVPYA